MWFRYVDDKKDFRVNMDHVVEYAGVNEGSSDEMFLISFTMAGLHNVDYTWTFKDPYLRDRILEDIDKAMSIVQVGVQ